MRTRRLSHFARAAVRSLAALISAAAVAAGAGMTHVGSPQAQAATAPAKDLAGRVFVLNPGHNGGNGAHPEIINDLVWSGTAWKACDTTGTSTNAGYSEHAHNWDVAIKAMELLKARGATVILTRDSDSGVGPCITTRADIGNRSGADAVVSIHADGNLSAGARGFHLIVGTAMLGGTAVEESSMSLARTLRDRFAAATGMPYSTYTGGSDAINVRNDLGGINLSAVPALFIETGNMRSATDAGLLSSGTFRQREAVAIADALGDFVGNASPRFPSDGDGDGIPARLVHGPIDVDGDGIPDIIKTAGTSWATLDGGKGSWRFLRTSKTTLRSVVLADFTGDGRTDALYPDGASWLLGSAMTGAYTKIRTSSYGVGALAVGDFDGDGRADIFRPNGTQWRIAWQGKGDWHTLKDSAATLRNLAFADVNGDGRTDVVQATGIEWRVSLSGSGGWQKLRTSSMRLDSVAFADVTGDGKDDAICATGTQWFVSPAAASAWQVLRTSSVRLDRVGFADLNGDRAADAIAATGSGWVISTSAAKSWVPFNGSLTPIGAIAIS